jgi:Winged helix DNA-binding domain
MSPTRLVASFGAVQSQDYSLGTWSIAQRLANPRADVERAVADGSILRTHVLRPTWHFVARDDLRWMQSLTSPRVLALVKYADRANGIDGPTIARATKAIAGAIDRRGHLARPDIADVLKRAGIAKTAWQIGQLLMHAELRTVICSGVPAGRRQTYALVDERAPRMRPMPRDEALATLARRYFQSHGPATARDFQWWSGLSARDVARALDMLGRVVSHQRCGDRTFISIGSRHRARPAKRAHLIQPFDEFVVAYSESRDAVDAGGAARTGAPGGGAALLARGVLYDSQLVARWQVAAAGRSHAIWIQPLRRLSATERDAVAAASARFERFVSLDHNAETYRR